MKRQWIFLLLLFAATFNSCGKLKKDIIIKSSEVGVYFNSQDKELKVLTSGMHKVPLRDHVLRYPTKTLTFAYNAEVLTKDEKSVVFAVSMDFKLKKNEEGLKQFHQEIGPSFEQRIVMPAVSNALRTTLGVINSQEIQSDSIEKQMIEKLNQPALLGSYFQVESLSCKLKK
jgi:hypothetical protein